MENANQKTIEAKGHLEAIINNTFNSIQDVYDYQTEKAPNLNDPKRQKLSRIVFPQKRDELIRISEQELRFVFVEQLNNEINKGWNVYYSVETPTQDTYSFKKDGAPAQDNSGRSGEFDLVIFNEKLKRIALIEFKANNAPERAHEKDFVKLNNYKEGDDNVLRCFIEMVKSFDDGTLSSLHGKIESNESLFRCWSLEKRKDITKEICTAPIKEKSIK